LRKLIGIFSSAALLASSLSFAPGVLADTTVVVKPSAMNGWVLASDTPDVVIPSFVVGPTPVPLGVGSARFVATTTANRPVLATGAYIGESLASISNLEYRTYRSAPADGVLAVSLQFDIDFDSADGITGWQGRLVYEPYLQPTTVSAGVWQTWHPLAGRWWFSGLTSATECGMSAPCTWPRVLEKYPRASVRGAVLFKAGGGWASFDGNVDAFTIGVGSVNTTYDYEPETPCTSTCYVDAITGNDAFGGDTPASAKRTIQAAVDAVSPGGTVRVLPGTYSETATNRWVLGTNGPQQFGLFVDKDGVTIQGVDASDVAITSAADVAARVTTNATNNFGYSGIFAQGDGVTIAGLEIGPNAAGDSKTIEVIGDAFTLRDSRLAVPDGGSVYLNDWRFNTSTNTSWVQTYTITGNIFEDGTSVDVASGAGFSGPVSGRLIRGNTFNQNPDVYWPVISFNGSGTGVPWFTYSVGGAVITGNTFGPGVQYIRARGTYDNTQFDWTSYWNDNTYAKAAVVGPNPPSDVRTYEYAYGSYDFRNVRRIGGLIQPEIDHALADDTVLVKAGTYPEQVDIDLNLHLIGAGAETTTVLAPATLPGADQTGSTIVRVHGTGVTAEISGFTISGPGPSGCGSIQAGVFVSDDATARIQDNRIADIRDDPFSGCQNGMGILVGRNSWSTVGHATITNNVIDGYQKGGIVVDNAGSDAVITGNTVVGAGPTTVNAQNGIQVSRGATALIRNNAVSGNNYTPPDWLACGLLMYEAGGVRASGNVYFGNEKNVCNFGKGGGKYNPNQ